MKLRPYQQAALDAIDNHLRTRDDNPCVVLPTGSGKTPLLAQLCQDAVEKWGGRVLVVSHVKELLEQSVRHLAEYLPVNMVGLHSAGLGRRDMDHPVLVAGIQSVYGKAFEIMGSRPANLIIVDEAHRVSERNEGMYRMFLKDAKLANPDLRVIGLTATPYRMGTGRICKPENVLNHICYEANVKELIVQGWLSPLRSRRGIETADMANVRLAPNGEFASDEMQTAFDNIIKPACEEIVALCAERKSVLVFAAGVKHAEIVARTLGGEMIVAKTSPENRSSFVAGFRRGEIKYLVNVGVLTTGFDAPNVDCVVLLRATMSAGLYSQMVGRGLRKTLGKTDCLILDYGDNVIRHGPIDMIVAVDKRKRDKTEPAPGKECPSCHEVIAAQYHICPNCEYEFPRDFHPGHHARAGEENILSEEGEPTVWPVYDIHYYENVKEKSDGISVTLGVEYIVHEFTRKVIREFIGFGHQKSFVRQKAAAWWRERSLAPVPETVMDAFYAARRGALAPTKTITTLPDGKYEKIIKYELGEKPEWFGGDPDEDFFAEAPSAEPAPALENIPF